ncbi:D-aminoacyl-tRNA deacylase [Burkholderia vietnamiensis]|uniref:D-aminoacyl-tRNA deacylase n=1 Tax=Burkholderia vietnamiensis TaxID=60552 RepID=UPI000F804975|nr:D-aminoacyl-tRNA deacylase [Burkholderia vietnamiensis]
MNHIVLAFCTDLDKDPVSSRVLARLLASGIDWHADGVVDGRPILHTQSGAVRYSLLQLDNVFSHDYRRYAPLANSVFADADAIVIVNWHEGKNAPDRIFTIQTTGDMESGTFSPVDPAVTRGLFLAVEHARRQAGLDSYSTWMEATHWSGPLYGAQSGCLVAAVEPSVIDLEIGSTADAWACPDAVDVLARALLTVGERIARPAISLLCIGGVHFEPGFTQLLRDYGDTQGLALSHVLPNHWLVAYGYDSPDRLADLLACARSIKGGVDAIAFHDNLKGAHKQQVRSLASELGVPALSHRKLRSPDLAGLINDAKTVA